jgi:hypothetical protein
MSRIRRLAASGVIGVFLAFALLWCWVHLAASNPLPGLLLRSGFGADGTWLALTASDFLMNIIMCLPAAWALNSLGKDLRLNTLVSVVAFAASSSFLVGLPLHEMSLRIGIQYSLLLASLPVAVWVFSRLRRRRA